MFAAYNHYKARIYPQIYIDTLTHRYILEARKRALAKKTKLKTLGKRTKSVESEDEVEEDGNLKLKPFLSIKDIMHGEFYRFAER